MREVVTPTTICPQCRSTIDRCSAARGDHVPRTGDVTVCVYCGAGLVFRPDMTLRVPTLNELAWMQNDPLFCRAQRVVRELRAARN